MPPHRKNGGLLTADRRPRDTLMPVSAKIPSSGGMTSDLKSRDLKSRIVAAEDLRSVPTPVPPEGLTEYRVLLVYPDGSSRLWDVFRVKDKMETKLRAVARRPGVRYHCEEWA